MVEFGANRWNFHFEPFENMIEKYNNVHYCLLWSMLAREGILLLKETHLETTREKANQTNSNMAFIVRMLFYYISSPFLNCRQYT